MRHFVYDTIYHYKKVYDTMRHFIIFFENRVYDTKVYDTKCTTYEKPTEYNRVGDQTWCQSA